MDVYLGQTASLYATFRSTEFGNSVWKLLSIIAEEENLELRFVCAFVLLRTVLYIIQCTVCNMVYCILYSVVYVIGCIVYYTV